MDVVRDLLVVLHLIGMAAIVGGVLSVLAAPRVTQVILWGARAQIVTGLVLYGLHIAGVFDDADEIDHAKIGIKIVVAFVLTGLAEANAKKGEAVNPRIVQLIGVLGIVNVLVAVLWH